MSNVVPFPNARALWWRVALVYRSRLGPVEVVHELEEIEDLTDLIERGPNWNSLIIATVALVRPDPDGEGFFFESERLP